MGWPFKRNRTVSHAPGTVDIQQVSFVVEIILSLLQYCGCVPLLSLFHMLLPHTDSRRNSKDDSEELSVTSPSDDKTPKSTASTASSDSSEDEQGGTISELREKIEICATIRHMCMSFMVWFLSL